MIEAYNYRMEMGQGDVADAALGRSSHSGDVTKDPLLERGTGVTEHSVAVV